MLWAFRLIIFCGFAVVGFAGDDLTPYDGYGFPERESSRSSSGKTFTPRRSFSEKKVAFDTVVQVILIPTCAEFVQYSLQVLSEKGLEIKENEKEDVSCAIKKRGGLLAKEECNELIKISSGNVSLFLQLIELDSETFEAVKQIYDSSHIITKDIIDRQTKTILELRTIKFNRIKELAKGSSGVAGKLNTLEPEEFEKVQRLFPLLRVKIDTNIIDAIKNSPRTLTDEDCEEIKKIARGNSEVAARLISLTQEKFQEVQRLSALNIYINADIIDAIKNRPQALTDEDCEEIKKYEEALTLLHSNFSLFAAFVKKPTEDWPAFQAFLECVERHCAAVLEIAQSFTNTAKLNKDDMIAISKALLSKRELSTYELLDFARVAIKRESWWTFALTFMDPDSFFAIYEHHRRASQLLPMKKTFR